MLLESVRRLAESMGMAVFDVQEQDIHGGTICVIICKEGSHDVLPSVAEFIANEKLGGGTTMLRCTKNGIARLMV